MHAPLALPQLGRSSPSPGCTAAPAEWMTARPTGHVVPAHVSPSPAPAPVPSEATEPSQAFAFFGGGCFCRGLAPGEGCAAWLPAAVALSVLDSKCSCAPVSKQGQGCFRFKKTVQRSTTYACTSNLEHVHNA